ncbi:hypothetical protein DB31_5773 [Hyalangium minutum]|uniref:CHAT domain-containing protein n=1 Tax=Hyalangium minutum TaxID=394096 RepID=A0A085WSR8_9BACT|nr:hypothetical protein [Hyalangium minutum]KFE70731.1 hypothetical protein DB31_5773 [Hyalangium minutum]
MLLAGLNLWGTQLAVLPACDTGRGDIKLGQGVRATKPHPHYWAPFIALGRAPPALASPAV